MKNKTYALYKGDKYLCGGSKEDLATYLNVKLRTIDFYSSPSYFERIKNAKEPYLVIKVEDDINEVWRYDKYNTIRRLLWKI